MTGEVVVSLLISFVLADVVKIVPTDDKSSLHLHTLHNPRQDAATD